MQTAIDRFLACAAAYQAARGISDARLSNLLFNQNKRLTEIRNGGDMMTRKFEAVMQWFSDHWPDDLAWPADVDRPEPVRLDKAG